MAILCENALVVTLEKQRPILEGQQILIDRGSIAEVGKRIRTDRFVITKRIDCSGRIVMPGLVNTHSHLTEILQRSLRDNVRMKLGRDIGRPPSLGTVLVDGKVVVRGGRLTRVREEMLMRRVKPISKKMRKRYSAILRSEARNGESSLQKLYRNAFEGDERNFRS
jgi:cytosine/adenosine deaminase-related metal-dependent hydrolase